MVNVTIPPTPAQVPLPSAQALHTRDKMIVFAQFPLSRSGQCPEDWENSSVSVKIALNIGRARAGTSIRVAKTGGLT